MTGNLIRDAFVTVWEENRCLRISLELEKHRMLQRSLNSSSNLTLTQTKDLEQFSNSPIIDTGDQSLFTINRLGKTQNQEQQQQQKVQYNSGLSVCRCSFLLESLLEILSSDLVEHIKLSYESKNESLEAERDSLLLMYVIMSSYG